LVACKGSHTTVSQPNPIADITRIPLSARNPTL
jgi:hypothetical protein